MLTSSRRILLKALIVSLLLHAALLSRVVSLFPVQLDIAGRTINVLISSQRRGDSSNQASVPTTRSLNETAKRPAPVLDNAAAAKIAVAQPVLFELAATGVPALSSPPPGAAHEGVSGDDMRQYRLSLATAARRFRNYPALARQRGWEGTAEVALDVSASALVPDVVLVHSSGRGVLDRQALEMLTQAARVTTLPEGLKARDFRILLPVQFSLDDDQ
ncbi:energy transducer TonB [Propionivibrio sp.]|uniref:energy transducer TonB n=1 Tax=Propionivibrio sp. TaxID=2212460 RepID=UPI0026385A21|nr:energy transducer TonB [Propionivibrio sp.]